MRENIFVLLKKLLDRVMEFVTIDREYAETIMDTITSLRAELERVKAENEKYRTVLEKISTQPISILRSRRRESNQRYLFRE